ncbi:hypothetical protein FRC10_006129 [Ceratobasidium sp. 414]|nr:hypothetical protein FRC10_006129 [Ceratobasidium sp. 414]
MDLPQARSKTPFKEKAFNDSVLLKIKLLREADPNHFPTPHDGLVYNDFPLLLHIIVETCLESHEFSEKESQTHISHHFNLCSELNRVYKDRSFADILYNAEMPVEIVRFAQDNLLGGLQPSNSHDSFSSTFETPYLGDNHKLLVKTLNRELELFDQPATQRPYNLSMAVIQSSGMGKSRMLMEVGNEVFTIGITIREELPAHKTAYPPADVPFREYFEVCQGKSDEEQQADYAVLLRVLCDRFAGLIEDDFPGQTGRVLAQNVAEYLKEGSTDKAVGPNRRQLFEHVVTTATALREGKNKDSTLADLVVLLKESCQNLANLVHPHRLVNTVACIVYFDEAHALTKVVSPSQPPNQETPPPETPMPGNTPKRTAYHNLGKVLSFLVEVPMFFIFLSTNSHLHDFAPAPAHFPSTLASDGSSLITPFTGLPFDVFETKVLKSLKPRSFTLSKLCTTEVMVGFGRPL